MNICFFSREYPPDTHIGGIGTYTYNMASALAGLGHAVHVLTATPDSDRSVLDNGVWVHRIKAPRSGPKEIRHLKYARSLAGKVAGLGCRFDIVQASEFAGEAFWYAHTKNTPLVTRLATPFYLSQRLDGRAILEPRPFLYWMEKRQSLLSDGIFTSSRSLADEVVRKWRLDPSRVEVIPNSVDISRIQRLGKDNPLPNSLKNTQFLLYFGRLEVRKGVLVLMNALPPVLERFPGLNMVFVGSDSFFRGSSLRRHISKKLGRHNNRLVFIDNLPHEELFPIVRAAKVVILPSLWEAFGFVTVEAMALGRPVIATSGSGFAEIIEDNISGYLVEPGNSVSLAERVIKVLDDGEDRVRISEGASKRARDFAVSRIAPRLLTYYEKIRAGSSDSEESSQ